MKRRKAIIRISMGAAGIALAAGGFEWYALNGRPDFVYLRNSRSLLAALSETILPRTDTPGAKDANVQDFIVKMVEYCTIRKEQNRFISGLKDMQAFCKGRYGKDFEHCTGGQQQEAMAHFEEKGRPYKGIAGKLSYRYIGRSFFTLLKEYTVEGYCTSQAGATQGLAYAYIPGSFQGCIPLQPGQKAWATN